MEGFFGLLLIFGLVGIVLSFAMRKKENLIGKNWKKVLLGSVAVVVVCCVIAAVTVPKTEPLDIDVDIPATESDTVSSAPVLSEPIAESSSAVSPASSEAVSSSSAAASSETKSEVTDNPLLLAEWQTAPVMNGFGTEQIGERGYIQITKAKLKEITNEQMVEFVEKRVKDSGLNWVSIICGDGTGICFAGSTDIVFEYGEMDTDGSLLETIKGYLLRDGVYEEWD